MGAHHAIGKVRRLYPDTNGCYIVLHKYTEAPDAPVKDEYYHLPLNYANYTSLYSLAVVAAVHNYNLMIACTKDFSATPDTYPEIAYLAVDWV